MDSVLVVEDDPAMRDLVRRVLAAEGWAVADVGTGVEALAALAESRPDAVVLDLVLPDLRGVDVLRELRRTSDVPVLVVSGIVDVQERVVLLEVGADDYLTKPFAPGELVARLGSLLRRRLGAVRPRAVLVHGDLRVDLDAREVRVAGRLVALARKEFDLLAVLAASPRRVFTREDLLREVWGGDRRWQDPSTVTEHVRRLRAKIEADPARPSWITTVRGLGYRFEGAAARSA